MKRDTLAAFFRRAVIAALPLAGVACSQQVCGSSTWTVDGGVGDAGCADKCLLPGTFESTDNCHEDKSSAGQPVTVCEGVCTGRRPEGLRDATVRGSRLGRHFARVAHLEAASVPAFRRLRAELRALGAPPSLLAACTRAAADEVRHARDTARLARRFGARVPRVRLAPVPSRSAAQLAAENAREGLVRESFGALVATWQAERAGDVEVRRLMQRIAADETRHAELAWEIHRWLLPRLDAGARARVEAAFADALAQLANAGETTRDAGDDDAKAQRALGLPRGAATKSLARAFTAEAQRRVRAAARAA